MRGQATGIDVHHRLNVHVVVEAAIAQTDVADLMAADIHIQVFTDALVANEDTCRVIGYGVFSETAATGPPKVPCQRSSRRHAAAFRCG